MVFPDDEELAGVAHRTVSTGDDADDQNESEIVYGRSTQDEQGQKNKEYSEGRVKRARHSLQNARIYHVFESAATTSGLVFADAIEDHDSVVDAVTHDGEHACDKQSIYLDSGCPTQDRENAHHHQNVVYHGDNGAGTPAQRVRHLAESERDIEQDTDRSHNHGDNGAAGSRCGYGGRDARKVCLSGRGIKLGV